MPTYSYRCTINNEEFEEIHSIKIELEICPLCKKKNLPNHKPKRLISLSSFVLKGGGWSSEGYK
jgi:putative FmdB family regulatory protein